MFAIITVCYTKSNEGSHGDCRKESVRIDRAEEDFIRRTRAAEKERKLPGKLV